MIKKYAFFPLFSYMTASFMFCAAFLFGAMPTWAQSETDLREQVQANLPKGEDIQAFLQLSPVQAWVATAYSPPDSLNISACTLSFVKIKTEDNTPIIANSLSLLTAGRTSKVRVFNRSWTLPLESEGHMTLKNKAVVQNFDMIAANPALIESEISPLALRQLLNGLGYGQEIWQSFSLGEPQSLPTARMIPLINHFKKCALDNHFVNLGGPLDPRASLSDNPF